MKGAVAFEATEWYFFLKREKEDESPLSFFCHQSPRFSCAPVSARVCPSQTEGAPCGTEAQGWAAPPSSGHAAAQFPSVPRASWPRAGLH